MADVYDAHRPSPPLVLVEILNRLAHTTQPRRVVDLGSGTELSTRLWMDHADEVIGIEPNDEMRQQAEAVTGAPNVRFVGATAQASGLPDGCADVVTCSQALHWMGPEPTFAEVGRVLRAGGVFAAYDYDWPPLVGWEAEMAYHQAVARLNAIEREHAQPTTVRWSKAEHLSRMKANGHFRYVREVLLHHQDMGNAKRMLGLALSGGGVCHLRQRGIGEVESMIDDYRRELARCLGDELRPWVWSYRVRIGIKG